MTATLCLLFMLFSALSSKTRCSPLPLHPQSAHRGTVSHGGHYHYHGNKRGAVSAVMLPAVQRPRARHHLGRNPTLTSAVRKATHYEFQPRCERVGQYLTMPGEQCFYLVCDHGTRSNREHGAGLYPVRMACPRGTFVSPHYHSGTGQQGISPCTSSQRMRHVCPSKAKPPKLQEKKSDHDFLPGIMPMIYQDGGLQVQPSLPQYKKADAGSANTHVGNTPAVQDTWRLTKTNQGVVKHQLHPRRWNPSLLTKGKSVKASPINAKQEGPMFRRQPPPHPETLPQTGRPEPKATGQQGPHSLSDTENRFRTLVSNNKIGSSTQGMGNVLTKDTETGVRVSDGKSSPMVNGWMKGLAPENLESDASINIANNQKLKHDTNAGNTATDGISSRRGKGSHRGSYWQDLLAALSTENDWLFHKGKVGEAKDTLGNPAHGESDGMWSRNIPGVEAKSGLMNSDSIHGHTGTHQKYYSRYPKWEDNEHQKRSILTEDNLVSSHKGITSAEWSDAGGAGHNSFPTAQDTNNRGGRIKWEDGNKWLGKPSETMGNGRLDHEAQQAFPFKDWNNDVTEGNWQMKQVNSDNHDLDNGHETVYGLQPSLNTNDDVLSILEMVLVDELDSIRETEKDLNMGYTERIHRAERDWGRIKDDLDNQGNRGSNSYKMGRADGGRLKKTEGDMLSVINDLMVMREGLMKKELAVMMYENGQSYATE